MQEPLQISVPMHIVSCHANASRNYAVLCYLCCLKFCIVLLESSSFWNRQVTGFRIFSSNQLNDGERFKSMICSCVCIKSCSFPVENSKHRGNSKSCKGCGGRLLVGGREARQGSMLSNRGLELSSIISPHLTWKTASNGRQRAVRRARTSFTGVNIKNSSAAGLKVSKDIMDNSSKRTGDMPVSESEKVGVSILGRRFSDDLGNVPIKKRRFLLVHSPSLHRSSPDSDGSGHVLEKQTASYEDTLLNEKRNPFHTNWGSKSELDQERNLGFEITDLQGVNKKICDAVDFSGISILAAAACDSNIGSDLMNAKGSLSKADATEVQRAPQENGNLDLKPSDFMNAKGPLSKADATEVQRAPQENGNLDLKPHQEEEPPPRISVDLTGRTDSPFEASSSSVLPCNELNEVKSDGSVSSFHNIRNNTDESSSHDVRFPWDLNTAIDAWESHEAVLNSDKEATNVSEDVYRKEQLRNQGPSMDQMWSGIPENIPTDMETGDSRDRLSGDESEVLCASEMKVTEKPGTSSDSLAKDTNPFSSPSVNALVEEKHLKNAKIDMVDSEETKSSINKEMIRTVFGSFPSPIEGAVVSVTAVGDFALSSDAVAEERKEETTCFPFPSELGTEKSSSYSVSNDDTIVEPPTNGSGSDHGINNRTIEAGTDVQMRGVTHTRSPQAEKHEFWCVDLLACPPAEKGSVLLAGGNTCDNVTGAVMSGSNVHMSVLDETGHGNAQCEEKNACTWETIAVRMKMDTPKMHAPFDDMKAAVNYFPANVGSDVSVCKSLAVTPGNTDGRPELSFLDACATMVDDSASNSVQVALENHLGCHNSPGASLNDPADQATGMEKVEFLVDDDSQYEDGEFRESLACCWLDDGAEEGETEHVDYGSDRDADIYVGASNLSSVSRYVDNVGQLHAEVGMGTQNASHSSHNYASLPVVGSERRNAESIIGSLQGNMTTESGKVTSDGKGSAGFRKLSGWDRLPGSCRNSESRIVSISQKHDFSSGPTNSCDSINRGVGSSSRRDLPSQTARVQSSDMSHGNHKSYDRSSRSVERNGFSPRAERHRDGPRLLGRREPLVHLQARGRGDNWVDSFNHHASSRRESSGYYGLRNAAAAAVAKVESNGFVVAPDGTIVKAGGAGSASHASRQSVNSSSQNSRCSPMGRGSPIETERMFTRAPGRSRGMSPDRSVFAGQVKAGRYGNGVAGVSHRERYHGPMPDDIINSPSSLHHTISRRDGSFSPVHRRPLHLSHSRSRSPSRSRTRSPHRWASPRGRAQKVMNSSPGLRWRSRSPNFKSEARMDRPRAAFGERITNYASVSRNYTSSPSRSSRWIDGRKEVPEQFRDYDYKRRPERSHSGRVFSRGHSFDLMDPERRPGPNEYSPQSHFGRVKEFVGFGRGSRNDGRGDDSRKYDGRYEALNSARQYVNGGNVKRYDNKNEFMAQTMQPSSSEFQQRDNLRAFDRDTEREHGDSPRRSRDEKGHFRNGNDGNYDAHFKSFGIRDGDSNMAAEVHLND